MLNVHASILPRYRGASPIIYAIKNHESKTGVSVMRVMPKKFDIGDVLAQKEVSISDDVLMPVLHDELAETGAKLLMKTLENFDTLKPIKQDDKLASYGKMIRSIISIHLAIISLFFSSKS